MNEIPLPESARRRPEPVRIFSGARLKPDGTYVSPAHQTLSDLWTDEMNRRHLPGILKRTPTTVANETRVALRITPKTKRDMPLLEGIRNRLEKGVMEWIHDGKPPFTTIDEFRDNYILDEEAKPTE